jgi:RNA polymerase sigma-70 factor (ECF subfamily)
MIAEETFLALVQEFDEHALAEVYDVHSPELYRYAWRLLGDAELAEDCVADTFSRFLGALRRGAGPQQHLRAYLFRTAHNWITDYYRGRAKTPVPLDAWENFSQGDDVTGVVDQETERAGVRFALSALTVDQRQVIVLKYVEDWDNNEIARALGKPVGAIKALQHRALQALRRHLVKE